MKLHKPVRLSSSGGQQTRHAAFTGSRASELRLCSSVGAEISFTGATNVINNIVFLEYYLKMLYYKEIYKPIIIIEIFNFKYE